MMTRISTLVMIVGLAVTMRTTVALASDEPRIKPGDRIFVLDDTYLQAAKEKLAPVEAGTELVAGQVRGVWVGVTVEHDGKKVSGWIPSSHLIGDPAIAFARLAVGYESEIQFAEADFQKMDTNADGRLSFDEFLAGTRPEALDELNQRLRRMIDTNRKEHTWILREKLFHEVTHCHAFGAIPKPPRDATMEERLHWYDEFWRKSQFEVRVIARTWKRQPTYEQGWQLVDEFLLSKDMRRSRLAQELVDREDPNTRAHRARALLKWADGNGDGTLSLDEFKHALERVYPDPANRFESLLARLIGHQFFQTDALTISLGIWFGGALTEKNLAQLEKMLAVSTAKPVQVVAVQTAPLTEKELARLEAMAEARSPNDRTQAIAIKVVPPHQRKALSESLERIRSKCPVCFGNVPVDVLVFVGFLNKKEVAVPHAAEDVPAHAVLDRLVGLASADGQDVYIFDGDVPWHQKYIFDGRGLRDQNVADRNMNVGMLAKHFARVAWYAGSPGGADFGAFLDAVRTRVSGSGQIRPVKRDDAR